MVTAGAVDPAPLRLAGWQLRGVVSPDPFAAAPHDALPPDAGHRDPAPMDLDQVLADGRLDAVAVDGADPALAGALPELRSAGLLLLLPTAAPLDPELLRAARAVPDAADAAVGLLDRWAPWALTVAAALPLVGSPVLQVTVRGWPRGPQAAAELVDLVGGWCGEVVAVVAAPAPLPAETLAGGEPVSWALLTAAGTTVLVSHAGAGPLVRLSFATARLEAGPRSARWLGGDVLPLLPLPSWVPLAGSSPPGLVATAAALAQAVGGREVPATDWPWPADLGDLLVVARVLEALRTSARVQSLVPVA